MSEEILKKVVAQVDGTVVDAPEIPSPSPPEEVERPEVEKKALEEEPKKLVVSFLDFLQDSVVPSLKYLDGKRKKYVVAKKAGFYVQLVRNRTKTKRAIAVKRKWEAPTAMANERVASLSSNCAIMKLTLQEREDHLRAKEIECKVFWLNWGLEKDRRTEEDRRCLLADRRAED